MSMLHTINKSPFMNNSLTSCLRLADDDSAILFIEDGVYAVLKGTEVSSVVEEAAKKRKVYALSPDLAARGVQDRVIDGVELVDYDGFVDLTVEYPKVHAWL
jgi:tRNA 2-thiouridine synthesizing protein B